MGTIIKIPLKRKPAPVENKSPLVALVLAETKRNPVSYLGVDWAAITQPELARRLGISVATLKRQVREQGLCACSRSVPKQWLIRVGPPVTDTSHVAIAKKMSAMFRKRFPAKKMLNQREFGCLVGLAEHWPEGHQIEIFRHALRDWVAVMAAVKIANDELPEEEQRSVFYDFPCIPVMRKFHEAVFEAWFMEQQAAGFVKGILDAA